MTNTYLPEQKKALLAGYDHNKFLSTTKMKLIETRLTTYSP